MQRSKPGGASLRSTHKVKRVSGEKPKKGVYNLVDDEASVSDDAGVNDSDDEETTASEGGANVVTVADRIARTQRRLEQDRLHNDAPHSANNSQSSEADCAGFGVLDGYRHGHCSCVHFKDRWVLRADQLVLSPRCPEASINAAEIDSIVHCVYSHYSRSQAKRLRECLEVARVPCLPGSGFIFRENVGWVCWKHVDRDDMIIKPKVPGFQDLGVPILGVSSTGRSFTAFVDAKTAALYTSPSRTAAPSVDVVGARSLQSTLDSSVACPQYVVLETATRTGVELLTPDMLLHGSNASDVEVAVRAVLDSSITGLQEIGKTGGLSLYRTDLESANPGVWLNDQILNAVLLELGSKFPDVYVFHSFFFTKLTGRVHVRTRGDNGQDYMKPVECPTGGYTFDYDKVKHWAKAERLLEMAIIIIPINICNTHWIVAFIFPGDCVIQIFDSMGTPRRAELEVLWKYWFERARVERKAAKARSNKKSLSRVPDKVDPNDWKLIDTRSNCAQQRDFHSCGVLSIGNAIAVVNGISLSPEAVTSADVALFRLLFQHSATSASFSAVFGKCMYVLCFTG